MKRVPVLIFVLAAHDPLVAQTGAITPAPVVTPPAAASATAAAPVKASAPAEAAIPATIAPNAAFDAFRSVVDKNIFNPNRSARRERPVEEPVPRTDLITLVGTMESERGGLLALFDGSESGFRKALRVGDTIEQFKVTRIGNDGIDLDREGKTMAVRVGQQLRRPEGADWTLVGLDAIRGDTPVMGSTRADPAAPPVIPANADEVTRRLMERRQKQLKQ